MHDMTHEADIQLRIKSNPLYLCGVRELVAQVAARLGFAEDACCQLKLAVDEALANVIRHGYEKKPDMPIWVEVRTMADPAAPAGITIIIEDEARQVDPATIRSRDLDEVRPGGLGVHIIQEVMDEVRYEKRDIKGMRLTMTKLRSSSKSDTSICRDRPGCCGREKGIDEG